MNGQGENAKDVSGKYSIDAKAGKLTIEPAKITIRAKSATFVYDGEAHEEPKADIEGNLYGAEIDYVVSGSITYVDDSPVENKLESYEFKKGDERNYEVTPENGTLTMTYGEQIAIVIKAADDTWTYDGEAHANKEVTVVEGTLLDGDYLVAEATGSVTNVWDTADDNNPVAAGYKIMNGQGENAKDVSGKYSIDAKAGKLTIEPRPVTIKATDNSVVYDGKVHGANEEKPYEVKAADAKSGLVSGHEESNVNIGFTAIDVGTYTDKLEIAEGEVRIKIKNGDIDVTDNYDINVEPGTLTITKRGAGEMKVVLTAQNNTVTYNGKMHGAKLNDAGEIEEGTSYTITNLAKGHHVKNVVIDADGGRKYVGIYEKLLEPKDAVIIDANDNDVTQNYDITYVKADLEITKRNAKVTITGPSAERVYTGEEQQIITDAIVYEKDTNNGEMNVEGMLDEDNILLGTVKHVVKGTYVGNYEGDFIFDGAHANDKIPTPTVLNDGYDVTENYSFDYVHGWLTIISDHPTKPDKEIDKSKHETGTKYGLGDRIYFTITVRNITLEELKDVQVHDPTAVIVPGDDYKVIDEHNALIESMAASVEGKEPTTVVITAYHVVTEDDIMKAATDDSYKYENVATIKVGDKTIDAKAGTNDIEDPDLTLEIVKKLVNQPAAGNAFKLGETAKFEITVTNLGNVTQRNIPVTEALAGAVFIEGQGYTLNADKTVATIAVLNPATKESQRGDSIVLYAQYTIKEEDLGNKNLKNIVTAPNGKPGEVPIPVDEAKSMAGQKIWNDLDNLYDTRTESVTINLMRKAGQNGAAEQYKTATVDQSTGWRYGFDHLPAHDMQNNEFFYWVEEAPITGYEPTYEVKDDSHCDIVNNLQTYTLTIHYWQHKLGDTKMEQAFPDYVATLYYKQPYDVESPEREGIILDDMSQARISGTMPAHDLVIDVYYHRIAYRLTIHYIYQDGTMAHEDYTWTYWFNSTYNVPSPIIPGFTPSIDVIAGRMPSHGLEFTVVYVGDGEIVVPDEDTSLGFKSYLNAGECFE